MKARKYLIFVEVEVDLYGNDADAEGPLECIPDFQADVYLRHESRGTVFNERVVGAKYEGEKE